MKNPAWLLAVFAVILSGCTTLSTIDPGGCGSPPDNDICLGEIIVPKSRTMRFEKASQQVIDAISSQSFKDKITEFYTYYSAEGNTAAAWEGFDLTTISEQLLAEINGMKIVTYGGLEAARDALIYRQIAHEGYDRGPIQMNRWGLGRPSAAIANTIAHEAAHRIGLSHPHTGIDPQVYVCEPPYIIGSLVEKTILGDDWSRIGHCWILR